MNEKARNLLGDVRPGPLEDRGEQDPPNVAADVTPEPAPPLDDADVPPLTDPEETKGG